MDPANPRKKPLRAPRTRGDGIAIGPGPDASRVRLEWPGRNQWSGWAEPSSPGGIHRVEPARSRLEPFERADRVSGPGLTSLGMHRLLHGEAIETSSYLRASGLAGKIDLVYLDPPFLSQADYIHEVRLDGTADGRVRKIHAYGDRWAKEHAGPSARGDADGSVAYLNMLAPCLRVLVDLLSPRGTIWVHLDWRASYLVRVLLDELMGRDRFINEIIWKRAPNLGRQAKSAQFGRTLDTLVVYGNKKARLVPPLRKEPIDPAAIRWENEVPFTLAPRGDYTDESIDRLEKEGRVYRSAAGKAYIKYFLVKNEDGVWCRERPVDALWTDIPPLRHVSKEEVTGYPTQKPRALLERVIACATDPGGIVFDPFSGSGTTAEAAHVLGRQAIAGDMGSVSIATTRARLLRAGARLSIERFASASLAESARSPRVAWSTRAGAPALVLEQPEEPLAWAVGTKQETGELSILWHSERTLGTKTSPVLRESPLPETTEALFVRVYEDDGSVMECEVPERPSGAIHDRRVKGASPPLQEGSCPPRPNSPFRLLSTGVGPPAEKGHSSGSTGPTLPFASRLPDVGAPPAGSTRSSNLLFNFAIPRPGHR